MIYNHAMLDLETLGVGHDARILSVGVQRFNLEARALGPVLYLPVIDNKGIIDPATVAWWMDRNEAGRLAIVSSLLSEDVESKPAFVIDAICSFFGNYTEPFDGSVDVEPLSDDVGKVEYLWSNGPTFDEIILRRFFDRYGQGHRFPAHFRTSRCFRTAVDLAGLRREDFAKPTVPHHALQDATAQVLSLFSAVNRLSR